MHLGLKRDFQVMPGTRRFALLCRHIPDRYEHLVRYVGWYSNRARAERAKAQKTQAAPGPVPALCASPIEPVSAFAAHAKSAWARLIRKVYEADPLECANMSRPDAYHRADRRPAGGAAHPRAPGTVAARGDVALPPAAWPANSVMPLTYHPVHDIA